jgi:hypothetical protein
LVYNSPYAVSKVLDIEVEQESEAFAGEAEISMQLRQVNSLELFHSLELNQHQVPNEKISPIAGLQLDSFVDNGNSGLSFGILCPEGSAPAPSRLRSWIQGGRGPAPDELQLPPQ